MSSSRRSTFKTRQFETLESRNMHASIAALGQALRDSLRSLADQSAVPAAVAQMAGNSVQRDVLSAKAFEDGLDGVLRSGQTLMAKAVSTNVMPKMDAGYLISVNPGGKGAKLAIDKSITTPMNVFLSDDRTGWSTLDRTFAGQLTGQATVSAKTTVRLVLEVTEAANGTLTVKFGANSRVEISGIDTMFNLSGRGKFGELSDVSLATQGQVTGQATVTFGGLPGALRTSIYVSMKATATTTLMSNDESTRGVKWSTRDESSATGTQLRASNTNFTPPKAVDLLKSAVRLLNGFRVNLPDAVTAGIKKALDVKVPFTGKTLGEQLGYPSAVPLIISTINPDKYFTFDAMSNALTADKRFKVLLQGESGADQFARGQKVGLVSVKTSQDLSKSFPLSATPTATYNVLPGVTLNGKSGLYATVKGAFDAVVVVDARGLGLGEGSKAGLGIKLSGALEGEVNVLGVGKYSLFSGSAKAEAYVEGTTTITVGRPLDVNGNATGTGVLYLGVAAAANPQRPITDFLQLNTDLKVGVEVSAKAKVAGFTVYKKSWGDSAILARSTLLPIARLN